MSNPPRPSPSSSYASIPTEDDEGEGGLRQMTASISFQPVSELNVESRLNPGISWSFVTYDRQQTETKGQKISLKNSFKKSLRLILITLA
jgi:hypothetical protein